MPNPELQFNAIQSTGNHNHISAQLYFPRKLHLNICANVHCHNWGGAMTPVWKEEKDQEREELETEVRGHNASMTVFFGPFVWSPTAPKASLPFPYVACANAKNQTAAQRDRRCC